MEPETDKDRQIVNLTKENERLRSTMITVERAYIKAIQTIAQTMSKPY